MIDGVLITPLEQTSDDRGKIMKMLRCDAPHFQSFGEIYFSCVYPGVVKGWHLHKKMTINYAVLFGKIRFVLYDDRPKSPTRGKVKEIILGPDNYYLVTVPPLIWNGFMGISPEMAIVANCTSVPHDPEEIERKNLSDPSIPYQWKAYIK